MIVTQPQSWVTPSQSNPASPNQIKLYKELFLYKIIIGLISKRHYAKTRPHPCARDPA